MPTGVYKRTKPAWNKGQALEKIKNLSLKISREDLLSVYQDKNIKQCADYFNVSYTLMNGLFHYYNISLKSIHESTTLSKIANHGNPNYNNSQKMVNTKLNKNDGKYFSEESIQKIKRAKASEETQLKYENTCLERYGYKWPNQNKEIKEKRKNTLRKKYGVDNPLQNKDIYLKHRQTMHINGTTNSSKKEEIMYKRLCEKYGESDVIRQYQDSRYTNPITGNKFNCDFYIKSEDLFIELNLHPSHGGHAFDCTNEKDLEKLNELNSNLTNWNKLIINVWTIRDPLKVKVAEQNNLKLQMIYSI